MRTYSRVAGAKHGWWTDGMRRTGLGRAPWLLALLLLAGGCLARAKGPDKLACPHPRDVSACTPAQGLPPGGECSVYSENKDWLPPAYVVNASCICNNVGSNAVTDSTADCVHRYVRAQTLQAKTENPALVQEGILCNSKEGTERDACFAKDLTPFLHEIHKKAYSACCCPCGPAAYEIWKAIAVIPAKSCEEAEKLFELFGSCSGTPGKW